MAAKRKLDHGPLDMIGYRDEPAVVIYADDMRAALAEAAQAGGCRVADAVDLADAADFVRPVGAMPLVGANLVTPALAALLDRLDADAVAQPAVLFTPPALIDAVAGHSFHLNIAHVCEPDQLAATIAGYARRPRPALHDLGRSSGLGVLQQLSEDAARLASVLAALSEHGPDSEAGDSPFEGADGGQVDAAFVRTVIRARRLRDQFFPAQIFADPGFDMLLDLFAARLEGKSVAVSSLCIAAAVPATTALRWIKTMTDRGLFLRTADPRDGRRIYIELSDGAASAMARYLEAAHRLGVSTL